MIKCKHYKKYPAQGRIGCKPCVWGWCNKCRFKKDKTMNENINLCEILKGHTPIEKAAIALIKIHQLIEVSYGGNITKEERENHQLNYVIQRVGDEYVIDEFSTIHIHIAFHTRKQAEEFLSYKENIQLLNEYFMV